MRVLELNVLPKIALMKQVVLKANSTLSTMFFESILLEKLLNCESLHMNFQRLTSSFYRLFSMNP